jgi:hypothetical protein
LAAGAAVSLAQAPDIARGGARQPDPERERAGL